LEKGGVQVKERGSAKAGKTGRTARKKSDEKGKELRMRGGKGQSSYFKRNGKPHKKNPGLWTGWCVKVQENHGTTW